MFYLNMILLIFCNFCFSGVGIISMIITDVRIISAVIVVIRIRCRLILLFTSIILGCLCLISLELLTICTCQPIPTYP